MLVANDIVAYSFSNRSKVCSVEYVRAWAMKFSGSKSTVLVKAFINVAVNTLFEFLYEIKFSSLTIKLIKQMHTDGNS